MFSPKEMWQSRRLPENDKPLLGKHVTALVDLILGKSTQLVTLHTTLDATGTTYIAPYASADAVTEPPCYMLMPRACSLLNFTVQHSTAGTTSARVRYTVRINGEDTSCVLTIAGNDTKPQVSPVKIPLNQFDKLSIKVSRPDGTIATAPTNILVSWELI